MAENNIHLGGNSGEQQMAKPLHIQRLEAALDMRPFLSYAKKMLSKSLTSSEDEDDDDSSDDSDSDSSSNGNIRNYRKLAYGLKVSKQGRRTKYMYCSEMISNVYMVVLRAVQQFNNWVWSFCTRMFCIKTRPMSSA